MDIIRVAIVGCGRILNAHLRGFWQLRQRGFHGFRITALAAPHEEQAQTFVRRTPGVLPRPPVLPPDSGDPLAAPPTCLEDFQDDVPVRIYTDYRHLFADQVADAVLDITPVHLHHLVGLAALEHGLHLLTQKPLAISVRAAARMVESARQKGLVLGVFENARYRPWVRAAHWAFATGLLGTPQMAFLGAIGGFWSPDRIVAQTPWRHDKFRAGGGASLDIGVHHMDILRYVIGEIDTVYAVTRQWEAERFWRDDAGQITLRTTATVEDTYFATLTFRNGALAQLLWSWGGHGEPLRLSSWPAFFGSRGCIQADQLVLDDGQRGSLLETYFRQADPLQRDRCFPLGLQDSFALAQWDWLQAIATGSLGPETSGEEGLYDLAAACAILESATLGRPVTLLEVLRGHVEAYQREINHVLSID
ncbi:Gfo/Idh/MocA family protein [Thermogemmata fonticola]|uniref:Gfo/Idh/MocA family protein n=1 Tax=Thermogemmata fonticola TaxID=2755323 RepID=UPI001E63409D|nr:Gfo/Idh/MocA family oxidoreductase [Thermogemmata fonticola]